MHAGQFLRVFGGEHGGADLRVPAARDLRPVRVPLALLGHQLQRRPPVGESVRCDGRQAECLIACLTDLPGSDPWHPLESRQVVRAVGQLQRSWQQCRGEGGERYDLAGEQSKQLPCFTLTLIV